MQCPTCGSSIAASAICPDCGTELEAVSPSSPSAPPLASGAAYRTVALDAKPAAPPEASAGSTPAASAARLVLQRNGLPTAHVFAIGARVTVGRFDPSSGPVDVDLGSLPEAGYVSRHHAALWRERGGGWRIMDLDSRNGTYVRPAQGGAFTRVSDEHELRDGDEIALGNARFVFEICESGEPLNESRA